MIICTIFTFDVWSLLFWGSYIVKASKFQATCQYEICLLVECIEPGIVLTLLGHKHNLLVKPIEDGFSASQFNDRYSMNRKGVTYHYEAYGYINSYESDF